MNRSILIVEDSPTQALRAKLILQNAGYHVDIAENGEIGLQKALSATPDLVVADINMPVMDGNEMTRRLRLDPRTVNVPIMMLTANDQPLDVILGLEVGADHFITKPYDDDTLAWQVNELFKMLEKAREGQLPEQLQVENFNQSIVITATRKQILQSLLQTTARVTNCQAMALFLYSPEDERIFFPISFAPLKDATLTRLEEHLTVILGRVRGEEPSLPTRTIPVVVEEQRFSYDYYGDLLAAFMNAPLIVEKKVVGIVSVFSQIPESFDLKNIGFLFELGKKAADALRKVKAG